MNQYQLAALITTISTAILSSFVLITNGNRFLTRLYAIYTFCISGWSFCWFSMVSAEAQSASLFWARSLHFPAAMIPPTFLHFSQCFLGINQRPAQRWLRWTTYSVGLFFILFSFHPTFVKDAIPKLGFTYYLEPGPAYIGFLAFFLLTTLVVHVLMVSVYKQETKSKQIQIIYLVSSYAFGYAGGAAVFLPDYGIRLPAFSLYSIPICHLLIAYTMLRYRFMDVRIALKATGRYLVSTGFLGGLFAYLSYLIYRDGSVATFVFIIGLSLPLIYSWFEKWLSTQFSRRGLLNTADALKIKSLPDRIQEAGYKISDLAETVTKITFDEVPTTMCAMFVLDHDRGHYSCEAHIGLSMKLIPPVGAFEAVVVNAVQ